MPSNPFDFRCRGAALAFALSGLLAACGGGGEAGLPMSAQATASRVHILADTATINTLFDWAEQAYAAYFPSHRQNQFQSPYTYRYYPETGVYLGVADDKVYVMGGPFGAQPLSVGLVADLLPAGPQRPAGTGNGCWDLDFMETPGRHIEVTSRTVTANGTTTGGMTQAWQVQGPRLFEGQTLLATETTVTLTTATGTTASVQRNTSYTRRASDTGVTIFGDQGSLTTGPVATTFSTVFAPPWTDTQYGLEPGQSVVQTWSGTSTTQGMSSPLRGSRTIRFIARETVTVPAGTFEACRFEQTLPSSPSPLTTWIARGWGVPVQLQSTTGGRTSTTQALSIRIDGVAVRSSAPTAGR